MDIPASYVSLPEGKSHQLRHFLCSIWGWWMQLPVTLSGYMALWNLWPKPILLLGNLPQLGGFRMVGILNRKSYLKVAKTEMWCWNVAPIYILLMYQILGFIAWYEFKRDVRMSTLLTYYLLQIDLQKHHDLSFNILSISLEFQDFHHDISTIHIKSPFF